MATIVKHAYMPTRDTCYLNLTIKIRTVLFKLKLFPLQTENIKISDKCLSIIWLPWQQIRLIQIEKYMAGCAIKF